MSGSQNGSHFSSGWPAPFYKRRRLLLCLTLSSTPSLICFQESLYIPTYIYMLLSSPEDLPSQSNSQAPSKFIHRTAASFSHEERQDLQQRWQDQRRHITVRHSSSDALHSSLGSLQLSNATSLSPQRKSPTHPDSYECNTAAYDEYIPNSPATGHIAAAANSEHALASSPIRHTTLPNDDHVPISPAERVASYTPLTTQVLLQHNLHASSPQDVDPNPTQHIASLHSLGIILPSALHAGINQPSFDMVPIERFQASSLNAAPQLNTYQGEMTSAAVAYAPYQEYTYGESSIAANHSDGTAVYAHDISANNGVFMPDQYGASSARYTVVDRGMDLAGAGGQFESYSNWDYTSPVWTMDDVLE